MFQEFLRPDLVLYGTAFDPAFIILHQTTVKQGELVIHQLIDRSCFDVTQYPSRMEQQLIERQIIKQKGEEFLPQDDQNDKQAVLKHEKQCLEIDETPDKQKNIQGYYQNQQNPFDDQYYGFNIDAQYAPQQFGSNQSKTALQESPYESAQKQHIPFSEKTPEKIEESKVGGQQQLSQEIDTQNAFFSGVADVEFGSGDMIDDFTQM